MKGNLWRRLPQGVKLLNHLIVLFLSTWELSTMMSIEAVPVGKPTNGDWGSPVFTSSPALVTDCSMYLGHSVCGKIQSQSCFHLCLPIVRGGEHFLEIFFSIFFRLLKALCLGFRPIFFFGWATYLFISSFYFGGLYSILSPGMVTPRVVLFVPDCFSSTTFLVVPYTFHNINSTNP